MMKSRILMMLTLLLIVAGVNAQKIDQRLTGLVEKVAQRRAQGQRPIDAKTVNKSIAVNFNTDGSIRSLSAIGMLKEGAECPTAQLEQQGIEISYQLGNMVVMNIPPHKLQLLDGMEEFYSVQADEIKQVMNNMAREETQANKVTDAKQAAKAGLPQAYTGNGVVLGIIDRGIDFNHAAFYDANGKTRVKRAIVFKKDGEDVVGKVYETEAEIMAQTTDDVTMSHGTHTAATAGGSEVGNSMQGVAPEADLILCGMENYATSSNIVECIKFIFQYATSVGKPAVVSISLGSILGLHDGTEAVAQGIRYLTENGTKPGRAVVVSSANAAANWQSIITYPGSTCKTVLGASKSADASYTSDYFFYASDYKEFTLELKLVNVKTGEVMALGDHVKNVSDGTTCDLKILTGTTQTYTDRTAFYGYLNLSDGVKLDNNDYRLAIIATPGNENQMIKMASNGDGNDEPCFDAPNVTGGYNFAGNGYTKGCGDFAFNTSICSDAVISVGAYITRNDWMNYMFRGPYSYIPSILTGEKQQIGEIADFSSYGVDDNGKARPTVIAPGMGIISAANNWDQQHFVSGQPGVPKENDVLLIMNTEKNNRQNWYFLSQGTSMSCPHTAGIVTLWMQAKPTLTSKDIQEVMKQTCVNDVFTTDEMLIPSHNKVQAGFGKVDCLAGLKQILGITGIETISMDGHREATPATMYSVDAPVYNMMGQRVDKNTRGLVIYKGRKYVNK